MKRDLQKIKERLECGKIRAETAVLRLPFYKKAAFYTSVMPVALAVLGLVFTWASGWFDVQRTRIENEKLLLKVETERLDGQTRAQQAHVNTLEASLDVLRTERQNLTNQITILEKERDEMRAAKQFFEAEAKKLAGNETNLSLFISKLDTLQAERNAALSVMAHLRASNQSMSNRLHYIVTKAQDVSLPSKNFKTAQTDFIKELAASETTKSLRKRWDDYVRKKLQEQKDENSDAIGNGTAGELLERRLEVLGSTSSP